MRVQWTLLTVLSIVGCATTYSATDSLEPLLPDADVESVRFFHGSWIWPDSIYAFQISENNLYIADPIRSRSEALEMHIDDCPPIASTFAELREAILATVKIASGEIAVTDPREIVVDGPEYRVEYWSGTASTHIVLKGDSNSQLVSPWIDAAYQVRAIVDQCSDS